MLIEQEHLRMRETDQQRGSPIHASHRNTPSPELAGLLPDPAINDSVEEPQHDVEFGYWMEVDDQYDDDDGREGDAHVSSDDEENAYRVFLSQEDAVESRTSSGSCSLCTMSLTNSCYS